MKEVKIYVPKDRPLDFLKEIPKDNLKSAEIYIHQGLKDAFFEAAFEEGNYAICIGDVKISVNSQKETWGCLYCILYGNDTLYGLCNEPMYKYLIYEK